MTHVTVTFLSEEAATASTLGFQSLACNGVGEAEVLDARVLGRGRGPASCGALCASVLRDTCHSPTKETR